MRAVYIFLLASVTLFSTGCEYQRVIKNGTPAEKKEYADKMYEKGTYIKALPLYEELLNSYNSRREGEQIYFRYAMCHMQMMDYGVAAYHFKSFTETFVTSEHIEDAAYYYALCQYYKALPYYLDQSQTEAAIEQLQIFINRFPNSEYVPEVNEKMDELRRKLQLKSYEAGMAYYHRGLYGAAVVNFKNTLISYPDIEEANELEYLIVESSYRYAKQSVIKKQVERYTEAKKEAVEYLRSHGKEDKYREDVQEYAEAIDDELKEVKEELKIIEEKRLEEKRRRQQDNNQSTEEQEQSDKN